MPDPGRILIFYDGGCGLCHGLVRFVLARDRAGVCQFAALDSATARALLGANDGTTLVVRAGAHGYTRSDAVLVIAQVLPAPWSWARVLRCLPRALRDALYDQVARHRHRLAGTPSCALPGAGFQDRFLP